MAYNFNRPYEVREKKCDELERKRLLQAFGQTLGSLLYVDMKIKDGHGLLLTLT